MGFYLSVDTDLADTFDKNLGQFTVSLATPIYFNDGNWKVAVLEYGFMEGFTKDKELFYITSEMVESQLICSQEQRVLITAPRIGRMPIFRSLVVPQFKRVAIPHCAKLTFSFITSDGNPVTLPGRTRFFMTLFFDRI